MAGGNRAGRGQVAAVVIIVSALASVLAPAIVTGLGLAPRFEMLIYLFAMAGFVWAFVVTLQLWRARK